MKTVIVVASLASSLVRFRGKLLLEFVNMGFDVHCIAPDFKIDPETVHQLKSMGVTTHELRFQRTGMNPFKDFYLFIRLLSLFISVRPDVFFGYTIKPVIYGSLASWITRVPHRFSLVTGLGYSFQNYSSVKKNKTSFFQLFINSLYYAALRCCHVVFFQNPDDQHLFRTIGLLNTDTKSVVVNGSGVDVNQYTISPFPLATANCSVTFLLIARLLIDKGLREYVEAARLVKSRYPSASFLLVGWIDENPNAIKQSELDQWLAEGVIEYLGRLSDVRPAIDRCSVYVLPSYREGTPRTVLEAMAMGRPIITTDAPGCRETVVDGDNGFLVPVKAVDELAAAMEKFIASPDLVKQMGARSRAIAESKYDVNAVNAVMLREMGITGKVE